MEDALIVTECKDPKVCEVIQTVILIFLYKVEFREKLRSLVRSRHAFLNTIENESPRRCNCTDKNCGRERRKEKKKQDAVRGGITSRRY